MLYNISTDAQRMYYVMSVARMETIKDLCVQDSIPNGRAMAQYDKVIASIKACNSNIAC